MRVLCVSDLHLDWRTSGFPRFDDVAKALRWAVGVAVSRKVDLFAFLGDAMDPDSGPIAFRCVRELVRTAQELKSEKIRSIWIRGNHDAIEDGSGSSTLSPLSALNPRWVTVCEQPAIEPGLGDVPILALPYPTLAEDYDPSKFVRENAGRLADVSREPGAKGRLLVLGHLMLRGIVPGEEATEMPRGRDVMWPTEELRKLPAKVTMVGGHVHKAQTFDGVRIVGSLVRLTHGEEGNQPGILVLDV